MTQMKRRETSNIAISLATLFKERNLVGTVDEIKQALKSYHILICVDHLQL